MPLVDGFSSAFGFSEAFGFFASALGLSSAFALSSALGFSSAFGLSSDFGASSDLADEFGGSPSSQIPTPQNGTCGQLGSSDIISVQAVSAQRFLRSFSYVSICFFGIARAFPPWLQGQQSSATVTQSLSVLQSRASAGARLPPPPPRLASASIDTPTVAPTRMATIIEKRNPSRRDCERLEDMTGKYIVPPPDVQNEPRSSSARPAR